MSTDKNQTTNWKEKRRFHALKLKDKGWKQRDIATALDGSPIHRNLNVKTFLADGAAKQIHLERLPAYAPDLNPDEGTRRIL